MVGSGRGRRRLVAAGAVVAMFLFGVIVPVGAAPTSWRVTRTPTIEHQDVGMMSVSCPAPNVCIALTQSTVEVQQWNGHRWSALGATPRFSTDLDCPTPTTCVAVGGWDNRASADVWNGDVWTPATVPQPGGYALLNGVSCVSATFCMAAGYGKDTAFFERFDGTSWSLVDAPTSLHGNAMYDVSCTSSTHCVAVGVSPGCRRCHASSARAETWDGEQWTVAKTPAVAGAQYAVLLRVSCGAPDRCVAVGEQEDAENVTTALLEQWNGRRWSVLPDPLPPDSTGGLVSDVSCAHGVDCVAVGLAYGSASGSLIAAWNGSTWSYPDIVSIQSGSLHAVDCVDPRHCVAVGTQFSHNRYRPLAFVGTSPARS